MGKPTGFKEFPRQSPPKRPVHERVRDWREIATSFSEKDLRDQGARCMDCGVPFCHAGCPLGNLIPDWNDLVYLGRWEEAVARLHATNCLPEVTGRICPAPCEEACVLGIIKPAVAIEEIERHIVERAFAQGWIQPRPPQHRTGKKVAVVGSGPSGLACAIQLNRAGHLVTVFERADRIGGLLRYGIPDFKLEKWVLDRRLAVLEQEGIEFRPGVEVGRTVSAVEIKERYDAIALCGGASLPRDLQVPGRELSGVHFAMDFLSRQNRLVAGDAVADPINAAGKHVIVIGGGDTGSDCVGTSRRHGARSVTQFELLAKPPEGRPASQPWPYWPVKLRTSTSHEEGCERVWSITTTRIQGEAGKVSAVETQDVSWNGPRMAPVPGSERRWPADLVVLAMGFLGTEKTGLVAELGLELDARGNVKTDVRSMTALPGVFAAGDMRRGQSLVVWALSEGRETARNVDAYLMGSSLLSTKGPGDLPRV